MDDMIDVTEELTEIVKGVNDGDDAEDAIEDIKDLKDEVKEIGERMKKLEDDMTESEKKEWEEKMTDSEQFKKLIKAGGDLEGELKKLPTSGTVGAADVAKAVAEVQNEMK